MVVNLTYWSPFQPGFPGSVTGHRGVICDSTDCWLKLSFTVYSAHRLINPVKLRFLNASSPFCRRSFPPSIRYLNRELKQKRRRRQPELQKRNRFRLAEQQLCGRITLFRTFLSRRFTTTTWKCLISRFVEDGNTRQQLSFSFPELWYSPLEFNSKTICQHLTN